MRASLIAGLDIGTTKTCAVIAELGSENGRRPTLKVLGVGQARHSGNRREVVTHIEEATDGVRRAMEEAELMAGVSVDRVWAAISGSGVEARSSMGVVAVGGEEIDVQDLERVHEVARAVVLPPDRELIHAIPQEYEVDHRPGIKDPLGMTGTRLEAEVHLVTCPAATAQNIRKAASRAGYRVEGLVAAPLASARSLLTEDEKEVGVAALDMGATTTELAVYFEGKIRHLAVLPFGGDTVTGDLVKGLAIPFAEAQKAKEAHGVAFAQLVDPQETVELPGPGPGRDRHVSRELLAHIVEQRLDEMFGLIREELESHDLTEELGAGFVLSGGGAGVEGTMELAQQVLGGPVRAGVPGDGLTGLADAVAQPRFATVTGLVLHGMERFQATGRGASTLSSGVVSRIGAWLREFF